MELDKIKEIIVVEGRDDTNAIKRAVRAVTIETHGFGISEDTWRRLDNAYEEYGLIIFTDPDHAGKEIRRRLKERYPEAKEAFLSVRQAGKKEHNSRDTKGAKNKDEKKYIDIGIENASPEDIREALSKAHATISEGSQGDEKNEMFTLTDLDEWSLVGTADAKENREALGEALGIGYYNGKSLLKVLNEMNIPRDEFLRAMKKIVSKDN